MSKYVLFVCGHNSGRSQMAKGFFNELKKFYPIVGKQYEAISAGTKPGDGINHVIKSLMREAGVYLDDLDSRPKNLDDPYVEKKLSGIERLVVACDDKTCFTSPMFEHIGKQRMEYWNLPDPHEQGLERVREIRGMVRDNVLDYLGRMEKELG